MEDLLTEFSPPSYDTWLALVEKEIKRKAEIMALDEVVFANPFLNPLNKSKIFQPISLENIPRLIFEQFELEKSIEINKNILLSLGGGTSAISVKVDEATDFYQLFNQIDLSLIPVRIICNHKAALDNLNAYLIKTEKLNKVKIMVKIETENNFKDLSVFEHEIGVDDSDNSYNDLLGAIIKFEKIKIQNDIPCYFSIKSKENFYLNITRIKTLRLLIKAVNQAYKQKNTPDNILCEIKSDAENPNSAIISLTQQFVSSISAGANMFLPVAPNYIEDVDGTFSKRITRNIFHLLQHESYMFRNDDPVAGSYIMDDMCEKLFNQIWSKFKELKSLH
jgi:hypothetical protein